MAWQVKVGCRKGGAAEIMKSDLSCFKDNSRVAVYYSTV